MQETLRNLAAKLGGRLLGDGQTVIRGAATLAAAGPHDLTLLDSPDKAHRLAKSNAGAVLVPRDFSPPGMAAIQVDDVHTAFAKVVSHFRPRRAAPRRRVSIHALVSWTATLGQDVYVGPGAMIGDDVRIGDRVTIHSGVQIMDGCTIGDDVTIFPNAVLYEDTVVGPRSILHAGVVLGAYGFGYKPVDGRHVLSSQLGYVEIGADVEIGANTTIDRGTYSATVVGDGTKIDNLVMIAHNCRIGRHNMICSQVGIAGSTTTGDYVVMAGQVGVRDHVHIGTGAVLGAMSGVANDVPEQAHMLGAPAVPEREQKLMFAAMSKLPEMRRSVKELQRQMAVLLGQSGSAMDKAA